MPTPPPPQSTSTVPEARPSLRRAHRSRVLVLAYSISPVRGSEYSVGWNHVKYMSEYCDLTVLYGLAGPHMGDTQEIENFIAEQGGLPNVTFVAIKPGRLANILNAPNRAGFLVYSFYFAYRQWHRQAADTARALHEQEPFDLMHYLCPIGYREPGFLWQIDVPYIWGPIGGMPSTRQLEGAPRPFTSRVKTAAKNALNALNLRSASRVQKALDRADIAIAATSENQVILKDRFACEALLMAENAIPDAAIKPIEAPKTELHSPPDAPLRLIWIGSLDWRKSPDLLLDALASVESRLWSLDIIGAGPLMEFAQNKASELGLAGQVTFHGQVPREKVDALLSEADLHLITSMAEGNPTTLWEAMAAGVPTVTLDHCGMHDVVTDQCGVRLPIGKYSETRDAIGNQISRFIDDRGAVEALRKGVAERRDAHLWSKRTTIWRDLYEQAICQNSMKAEPAQAAGSEAAQTKERAR